MWVLLVITLVSEGVYVESFGEFTSHGSCIVAMHEAEIEINNTNEGMLCLHVGDSYEG